MKPIQKTLARLLKSGMLILGLASLQTTGTGQTIVEGLRFNMFTAEGLAVMAGGWLFDWATGDILLPVGQGTYQYQYGSNATFSATIDQWQRLGNTGTVSLPYSFVGTNRWGIDVAGNLTGTPWDYSSWLTRSNSVTIDAFADTTPEFPAWTNRKAKGTIPSLSLTNIDCKLDLVILGERADFTNDVIVKFTVSATDVDTGQTIPDSDITVCGKSVADKVVWKQFKEWTNSDVTPVISGHSNYTFALDAEIARPHIELEDANITGLTLTNWPGATNNLYVGELFWPYATLGGWNNLITNYWWTVPGIGKVKDWNATLTAGFEVPFVDSDHCTNIDVWCSFVYPLTNAYLGCQIQIMGETLRPWSLINVHTPPVSVAWDTNQIIVDEHDLRFGRLGSNRFEKYEIGGVKFTNSIMDDAASGEFTFVQTLSLYREKHYTDGTNLVREYISGANLLDTDLPYWTLVWSDTGLATADSPSSVTEGNAYRKIGDNFSMYLMWQSRRAGSIPVTRWRFDWTCQAEATNDVSSGWSLIPGTTTGTVTTSTESGWYPFWTNNVQNILTNWMPLP